MRANRAKRRRIPGLGERIQQAREQWGAFGDQGREEFARAVGIAKGTLYEYEADKIEPGAWVIYSIAKVTGVAPQHLLFGNEKPVELSARAHAERAVRQLRRDLAGHRLPQELHRRATDMLFFVETQMKRLIFDAERFLAELRAHASREDFDAAEYRRRWLAHDDDEKGMKDKV